MNIAIKGNKDLKEDVIKILISLGGTNQDGIIGNLEDYIYYVDFGSGNNVIRSRRDTTNYIVFTVIDFYEKFPFKPGERVTYFENLHVIERLFWNTVNDTLRVILDGEIYALPEDIKAQSSSLKVATYDPFQVGYDVYWNGKLCCIVSINEEGLGKGDDPIYRVKPYDEPINGTYGAYRENLLPPDLDTECVDLVTYLNDSVGVTTFGSCCGHLENNYFVLFRCSDHGKLARLSRSVNRNYSDGKWLIELIDTDGAPCYNYMLRSKEPFVTSDEMKESVNNLIDNILHWNSSKFDSYFKTNGQEDTSVINLTNYNKSEIELILGDKEIIERSGKFYAITKKSQYPKTYKECCDVLGLNTMANDAQGYEAVLIIRFQELLIARNAYWKIAGEQMGLGKPWEPNWKDDSDKYFICYLKDDLWMSNIRDCNRFLVFPTKEMRDAFCENFKDSIENCKELL